VIFSGYHESGLITCRADSNYAIGACGQVVIAVWRCKTHLDGIANLSDYIIERAGVYPRGIVLLQIIEDSALPPDSLARKSLAKMHGLHARLIRRSAVVFTKPGFAGATARAIITGVAMLNPPGFEHQIFASLAQALAWVDTDLARERGPEAVITLENAVAKLRLVESFVRSDRRPPYALRSDKR
jgi:hypothetical protein